MTCIYLIKTGRSLVDAIKSFDVLLHVRQLALFPVATCWPMIASKKHKIACDMSGDRGLLILLPRETKP